MAAARSARVGYGARHLPVGSFVRRVKGGLWQARPHVKGATHKDKGARYDLGTFPTEWAAHAAVRAFFRGELWPLPPHTRRYPGPGDEDVYRAVFRDPSGRVVCLGPFDTRAEAAEAAVAAIYAGQPLLLWYARERLREHPCRPARPAEPPGPRPAGRPTREERPCEPVAA